MLDFKKIIILTSYLLSLFSIPQNIEADSADNEEHVSPFWGMSVGGYMGNGGVGWANALIPTVGQYTSFIHTDLQVQYHDDRTFAGGLGLGQRFLTEMNGIWGIYVFGDYNNAASGNTSFWFVSPGIERLGDVVDFSANVYIPVTAKVKNTEIVNNFSFTQHELTNTPGQVFYSTGLGADAEFGFRLPVGLEYKPELFLGGYYATPQEFTQVTGGTVRLEFPITNRLTFTASEAYDNFGHNTVKAGLNMAFAGRQSQADGDPLSVRLLDAVRRNLVSTTGSMVGNNQFIEKGTTPLALEVLQEHIWFFTTTGGSPFLLPNGLNNCTFEHPCEQSAFVQGTVTDIEGLDPDALLYFSPGTYLPNAQITIQSGQTLWGRTANYMSTAPDSERPVIQGAFNLSGDNEIHNLNISGSSTGLTTGIVATGVNDIFLDHVGVSNYTASAGNDAVGISMSNGNDIQFTQVSVSSIQGGNGTAGTSGTNGADNAGGIADPGTVGTVGTNGGNATGILLNLVQDVTLDETTISAIHGGNGGAGGNGGNGGDASIDAAGGSDDVGGTGGDGAAGSNGGNAGSAVGFNLSSSQNMVINNLTTSNIVGGNGGSGGSGGTGGNANTSNSVAGTADSLGGDGGFSGTGGNGGDSTAFLMGNNNQIVEMNSLTFSNIVSGNGGNSGTAGVGGNANVTNSSSGSAAPLPTASGGNGGDSGNGGGAGDVLGLSMLTNNQDITISNLTLSTFTGGTGGVSASGGRGGDANVVAGGDDARSGGLGGAGGISGNGGQGGGVTGISIDLSTAIAMDSITVSNLQGGAGGESGIGGVGGDGNVLNNVGDFESAGIFGGLGGEGGASQDAGAGGEVVGLDLNDSLLNTLNNLSLTHLYGGAGGNANNGGRAGNATASNNVNSNSTGVGTVRLEDPQHLARLGGEGGEGGDGGGVIGVRSVNSQISDSNGISSPTLTDLQAGEGGNGGAAGLAGAFSFISNAITTQTTAAIYTVVVTPEFTPLLNAGGKGGNGGDVKGFQIQNAVQELAITDARVTTLQAGAGGVGGNGGSLGTFSLNNNTLNSDMVSGSDINTLFYQHNFSSAGEGGEGGTGGKATGIEINAANAKVQNGIFSGLQAGAGGNGGSGGIQLEIIGNANSLISTVNTPSTSDAFGARGRNTGVAGAGGIGGRGGDVIGAEDIVASTVSFNNLQFLNLLAGAGGNGGNGGMGNETTLSNNSVSTITLLGTGAQTTNVANLGGMGAAGIAGGNAIGLKFVPTTTGAISNISLNSLTAGKGGDGGDGGAGGNDNVTSNSVTGNNPTAGGIASQGGIAQNGGNGANGGNTTGLVIGGVTGTITSSAALTGGQGGTGGNGAAGGNSLATDNTANAAPSNVDGTGGAGSAGGSGGNGGSANATAGTAGSAGTSGTAAVGGDGGTGGTGGMPGAGATIP